MPNRARFVLCVFVLALLAPIGVGAAVAAPECAPYCNAATSRIADRLVVPRLAGDDRTGWLATVLDDNGYEGRRWAEITQIPGGHGKHYVGIVNVPAGRDIAVRHALGEYWFAQKGQSFVLPLVTQYDTRGGAGKLYRTASKWAARRLGTGWSAVAPVPAE